MPSLASLLAYVGILLICLAFSVISTPAFNPEQERPSREDSNQTDNNPDYEESLPPPKDFDPSEAGRDSGANLEQDKEGEQGRISMETFGWLWGEGPAQWTMAVMAMVAAILSAIALGLLSKTLNANKKLLKQGRRMHKAARKSIKQDREIGQAQVRAYLSLSDFQFFCMPKTRRIDSTLKLVNSGQSPARDVDIFVCFDLLLFQKGGGRVRLLQHCGLQTVRSGDEIVPREMVIQAVDGKTVTQLPQLEKGCKIGGEITVGVFGTDVFKKPVEDIYGFTVLSKEVDGTEDIYPMKFLSNPLPHFFGPSVEIIYEMRNKKRYWLRMEREASISMAKKYGDEEN